MKLQVHHGNCLYLASNQDKVLQHNYKRALDWKFEDQAGSVIIDPTVQGTVRIIDKTTNTCLQPQSFFPVESGKREVFLARIQEDNSSQFWKFEPVPNHLGWFFIVNQMPEKNGTRNLCLDVSCKSQQENAEVITYHKKRSNAKTKNQW